MAGFCVPAATVGIVTFSEMGQAERRIDINKVPLVSFFSIWFLHLAPARKDLAHKSDVEGYLDKLLHWDVI
jgi:hypothetical protein